MKIHHALLALALLATPAYAQDPGQAESEAGIQLMEKKQYKEAEAKFREGLKVAPHSSVLLYNAGSAALSAGDLVDAKQFWQQLKTEYPDDWRVRPRLIYLYQQMGNPTARDAERKELYELRTRLKAEDFPKRFMRDKFKAGHPEQLVLAFESFEFEEPYSTKFTFAVFADEKAEKPSELIQVESLESDTQFQRETGQLKADERAYTLDWNAKNEHRTYAFFKKEPQYDELKKMVIDILEGKSKPGSSTKFPDKK